MITEREGFFREPANPDFFQTEEAWKAYEDPALEVNTIRVIGGVWSPRGELGNSNLLGSFHIRPVWLNHDYGVSREGRVAISISSSFGSMLPGMRGASIGRINYTGQIHGRGAFGIEAHVSTVSRPNGEVKNMLTFLEVRRKDQI